ncbi:glycosyltransferase family 1 protein [Mycena rebaudengoi]|nr:glycosyltransferase family 1 protein [Mycena rebaudengoi]
MRAFVTVGSFEFDALVQTVLSEPVLLALQSRGYTNLVVQCGNSVFEHVAQPNQHGLEIELWKFKPSLDADVRRADLVVGHAGSGTILDVLRLGKPLIVVPNPTLLHNHQTELASALEDLEHLKTATLANLAETIADFDPSSVVKFPPFDGSRFRGLVDNEMGF